MAKIENKHETRELQVTEKQAVDTSHGENIRNGRYFLPQVDILEREDAIVLRADVPGADANGLEIDVNDGILSLSVPVLPSQTTWRPLYREYEVGGYERRFSLGSEVDIPKISAALEHGVLTITLPKQEAAKPRRIQLS